MTQRLHESVTVCTGPSDTEPCGEPIVGRGALAKRCTKCAAVRDDRQRHSAKIKENRRRRSKIRDAERMEFMRVGKPGLGRLGKPVPGEMKRCKVDRCRVCLGTPHLREPGRLDEYGMDVCLPGMARCRGCWEPYAPLPGVTGGNVLGSSAAMAMAWSAQ